MAGPSTLEVLGHRLDVWVIKCACGAQHAANTLPVSLCVCVFSLTERAQLLKNVFKKSTVSLYRSDSMQQNLLRKLHSVSLLSICLSFPLKMPLTPKDFSLSTLDLSASKCVLSSGEQIERNYSSSDTYAISKTSRVCPPLLLSGCSNIMFILLLTS